MGTRAKALDYMLNPKCGLSERHHSAPELCAFRRFDVVFARKFEPAVAADAVDHDVHVIADA